jgi:microcystin degradation protein MlrC/ATP adenylyltransferase/5',5'''-P-1,P-4-tetraphosphate phosphorylase II
MMDVVIARLSHETNTFAPVTEQSAFFDDIAGTGAEGFVAQCQQRQLKHAVSFVATANPSGPVEHAVFEGYAARLLADLALHKPRAILLDLHGAMVTTQLEDAEGELLRRVRDAAPDAVVGVCLDLHGNVTPAMVAHSDVMCCYQTYPHIDMRETGVRVACLVLDQLLKPRKHFEKALVSIDVLASTLCSRTDIDGPMLRVVNAAKQLEADGVIASGSIFAGFPLSDTHCSGLSVVCYGSDAGKVKRAAHDLAAQIEKNREGFVFWPEPVEQSMREVEAALKERNGSADRRYVLLLDHADNVMSGGDASSLSVLKLLLPQSWRFLVGPVCHPHLASVLREGESSCFELGEGVSVKGKVIAVSSGSFLVTGPIYNGSTAHMGRTVAIQCENGGSVIVLSEKPVEPFDVGVFRSLNIDYGSFELLALKSRMYCRPVFAPDALAVIPIDCGGLTSSHYHGFKFSKLRRPIFPLDMPLTHAIAQRQAAVAVGRHALGPIGTKTHLIQTAGGIRFAVRIVTSLELKKKAQQQVQLQQQRDRGGSVDPFAAPDPDLVVARVALPHHVALLNKFPVIAGHMLLVTKEYHSQNERLSLEDFEALAACSDGKGWLAFYNCGPQSGCSQPHKHVQIVPYPFDDHVSLLDDMDGADLPFAHAIATVASWHGAEKNYAAYCRLLSDAEKHGSCESHNVLFSAHKLVVIPRRAEEYKGISLNSLAFAFSLFAPSDEACHAIEREGPLLILAQIAFPKQLGL